MTTIVTTRQRLRAPYLFCIILCIIPSPYFCYAQSTGMMMNASNASNTTTATTNTSTPTSNNTTMSPKNTLAPIPSEPPREPQQPRPDQINDCRTWGCSHHGTCDHLSYTCRCDEHYTGSLCEIHVNPCPDGIQTCYNGALCVPKRDQKQPPASSSSLAPTQAPVAWDWDKEREKLQLEQAMSDLATDDALFNQDYNDKYGNALYECQCVQHEQSFPLFDGDQCQHPLYTSCQLDSLRSDFTFCLNDGVCKQRVTKGAHHQGCHCLHNWTGFYCQLPPKEDQHTIPITNNVQPGSSSSNDKIVIAFVSIISLVFCCSLAAFVYYSRRAAAARDPSTADNEVVTLDDIEELEENTLGRRRTTGQVRAEREIS